jgi:hypothetical protein
MTGELIGPRFYHREGERIETDSAGLSYTLDEVRYRILTPTLVVLTAVLTMWACARQAPRTVRPTVRQVLFDEAHHNVHTAGGRYKPFVDLIDPEGYVVTPNTAPFTTESLQGYDLLVIANARSGGAEVPLEERGRPAFTNAEADAVREWVRGGGALLLITDHYPIGGAAQTLADRFGITMSNAFTEDSEHQRLSPVEIVFTRKEELIAEHPITRGVKKIVTFGGQSLHGPPVESVNLLRLSPTAMDRLPDGRRIPAEGRSQALALPFGNGRVVVLGEAAMLTTQEDQEGTIGFTVPGYDNRQFALNVVRWLTGDLR